MSVHDGDRNPYAMVDARGGRSRIALCLALLMVAVYVPFLAGILSVTPPSPTGWLLIAAGSLTPLVVGQLYVTLVGKSAV